jgi:Flp pilus assembly protein TadB
LDSFMWGSYPASLRNVAGSTRVPVGAWNNAQRGTWGLPLPVKLERRDMTYTVLMWRNTQNKTNKILLHYVNKNLGKLSSVFLLIFQLIFLLIVLLIFTHFNLLYLICLVFLCASLCTLVLHSYSMNGSKRNSSK